MKRNLGLDFYEKYNISTNINDISDINRHYKKREKLYRQLGVPSLFFLGRNILEIGPAEGYSSLFFLKCGASVDLVEPNEKARKNLLDLFFSKNISTDNYNLSEVMLEDFKTTNKYDFICAESFLQFQPNAKLLINKLMSLTNEGGIIVITCSDEISMFIEEMKRLIGLTLSKDIIDFDEKVAYLVKLFEPQLKSLAGMSRTPESWVCDQILNLEANSGQIMNVKDAISYFTDDFELLGGSPNMLVDYSFFKDIDYNCKEDYFNQFDLKRHNLLWTKLKETTLPKEDNIFLYNKIKEIKNYQVAYENDYNQARIEDIIKILYDIQHIMIKIDIGMYKFVEETIEILKSINNKDIDLSKYNNFYTAFGRAQQYISMIKKRGGY